MATIIIRDLSISQETELSAKETANINGGHPAEQPYPPPKPRRPYKIYLPIVSS